MIHDGRSRFRCSLLDFIRSPQRAEELARSGYLMPTIHEVAEDAEPAPAVINVLDNVPRWIVRCPDCPGAQYVWLEQPIMFCMNCGNRSIGRRWRRVAVPANKHEIIKLLEARPNPANRNWEAYETLDDLRAQNAELGV